MTRVTNFGIKRKYVQAGFGQEEELQQQAGPSTLQNNEADASTESAPNPPTKKKRKRTPKSQRDYYVPKEPTKPKGKGKAEDGAGGAEDGGRGEAAADKPALTKAEKKKKKFKDFVERKEKGDYFNEPL